MKRGVVPILFLLQPLLLFVANAVTPPTPDDFGYSVDLMGPIKGNTQYQVHLSKEILQKCATDCNDMRLFDAGHNEIPYVVIKNESPGEKLETYPLEITSYADEADFALLTLKLPDKHRPIRLIDLDIADRDFLKSVVLEGSHDLKSWNRLAEDSLFDFSSQVDLRKTQIEFAKSDHRYYRLKLMDTRHAGGDSQSIRLKYEGLDFSVDRLKDKKLRIHKVMASTVSKSDRTVVYDEAVFRGLSAEMDKDRHTVIVLEASLPVDKISFDVSNPYYYRKVAVHTSETGKKDSYQFFIQGSIHSFPLSGSTESRNDIQHRTTKHRYYKFIIENQNSPPLNIKSIKFEWAQKYLYFIALADAEKYALYFGNETVQRPNYDLSNFIRQDNWFEQKSEILPSSQTIQNDNYVPGVSKNKKARIERIILSGIVILLVLGIGFWLYKLSGKVFKQEGA